MQNIINYISSGDFVNDDDRPYTSIAASAASFFESLTCPKKKRKTNENDLTRTALIGCLESVTDAAKSFSKYCDTATLKMQCKMAIMKAIHFWRLRNYSVLTYSIFVEYFVVFMSRNLWFYLAYISWYDILCGFVLPTKNNLLILRCIVLLWIKCSWLTE